MSSVVARSWKHHVVAAGIEKLSSHHHLLLLAGVRVWCLPLIDQVEQMSLIRCILVADSAGGADTIVANGRGSSAKCTGAAGVAIMLCHHGHVVLVSLWRSKIINRRGMPSIALPQLGHEVAIEHGLPHLYLLITRHFIRATVIAA